MIWCRAQLQIGYAFLGVSQSSTPLRGEREGSFCIVTRAFLVPSEFAAKRSRWRGRAVGKFVVAIFRLRVRFRCSFKLEPR